MKKLDFSFLTNKLFLSGLIAGILISAFAVTLIILTGYPAPDKTTIKGTMAETTYVPSVGENGTTQGGGMQCNYYYTDVVFDNDPNNTVIRCHGNTGNAPGIQVVVTSVTSGQFCSGGGIYLSIIPISN